MTLLLLFGAALLWFKRMVLRGQQCEYGFGELQEGWEESRKAQLFHQTKPTDSIILYSNIKQNLACTPTPALDISREVPDEKNINKDVIQEIQNFILLSLSRKYQSKLSG